MGNGLEPPSIDRSSFHMSAWTKDHGAMYSISDKAGDHSRQLCIAEEVILLQGNCKHGLCPVEDTEDQLPIVLLAILIFFH